MTTNEIIRVCAGKQESDEGEEDKHSEEDDETRRVKSYYAEDGDEEEDEEEEDEEEEEHRGFLESMFGGGGGHEEEDEEEETDDEEKYEFDEDFAAHDDDDDESYDGEEEADVNRDIELENKLEAAFRLSATNGEMNFAAFKQALATLGKLYTAEEIDRFFREAVLYQMDKKNLRLSSYDRDDRGLLQRSVSLGVSTRGLSNSTLSLEGFKSYYDKWLTRKIDAEEAAEHFIALVQGAAEIALRSAKKDDDSTSQVTNRHLLEMEKGKGNINEIFIYARDLRRVMVNFSEKLTDEEADQLIRECKPKPLPGAGDGGLDRIYFKQYLAMLKDETL